MAKLKNKIVETVVDKKTHKGYNEKNPTEPQGSFKADSMQTGPTQPVKKSPRKNKV